MTRRGLTGLAGALSLFRDDALEGAIAPSASKVTIASSSCHIPHECQSKTNRYDYLTPVNPMPDS